MWYKKYADTYGRSLAELSESEISSLRDKVTNHRKRFEGIKPTVTVAAIAYNEERHLYSCLNSLYDNHFDEPTEIYVVNNNSKDNTEELLKAIGITYYTETKQSTGYARQCAVDKSQGQYMINVDSDTVYPPNYVSLMIKNLKKTGTVGVYCFWHFFPDESHSAHGLRVYETLRNIYLRIQQFKRPELVVRGMVFAYIAEYARNEGIRGDIIRGEDGSLALALKKYGKLRLVTSSKVQPYTGYGTIAKDGGILTLIMRRAKKAITNIGSLFTKKEVYEDQEDNLISKK